MSPTQHFEAGRNDQIGLNQSIVLCPLPITYKERTSLSCMCCARTKDCPPERTAIENTRVMRSKEDNPEDKQEDNAVLFAVLLRFSEDKQRTADFRPDQVWDSNRNLRYPLLPLGPAGPNGAEPDYNYRTFSHYRTVLHFCREVCYNIKGSKKASTHRSKSR